jgi:hypothetical protein
MGSQALQTEIHSRERLKPKYMTLEIFGLSACCRLFAEIPQNKLPGELNHEDIVTTVEGIPAWTHPGVIEMVYG